MYSVPVFFSLMCAMSCTTMNVEGLNPETAPGTTSTTSDSEKVTIGADDNADYDLKASRELDLDAIMRDCNDSFTIEMEYLTSLNDSGSFPDETDKTPKCYIRCYLERTGVMDGQGRLDTEQASLLLAGSRADQPVTDLPDITETCAGQRDEKCLCEKAYAFMRCVMETEIDRYFTEK